MSLSNELSSEVAAAILSGKDKSPQELNRLKEILLVVQAVFQRIDEDRRVGRFLKVGRKAKSLRDGSAADH